MNFTSPIFLPMRRSHSFPYHHLNINKNTKVISAGRCHGHQPRMYNDHAYTPIYTYISDTLHCPSAMYLYQRYMPHAAVTAPRWWSLCTFVAHHIHTVVYHNTHLYTTQYTVVYHNTYICIPHTTPHLYIHLCIPCTHNTHTPPPHREHRTRLDAGQGQGQGRRGRTGRKTRWA